MRRAAAAFVGTLLVLVGSFALVVGVVLLAVFGMDGTSSAGPVRAVAASSALVVDTQRADAGLPAAVDLTTLRLSATAVDRGEVFVGVGPAQDVLAYLSGSPYDIARGVDGRSQNLDQVTVQGTGQPSPPAAQSFWSVQASGSGPQTLTLPLTRTGELIVVMNADAAAPVDVRLDVGVDAAWIGPAAIAAVAGGAALLLLGLWFLLAPRRRERDHADAPPSAGPDVVAQEPPSSEWGQPIAVNEAPLEGAVDPTASATRVVDLTADVEVPRPRAATAVPVRVLATTPAGRGSQGPEGPPREPGA